MNFQQLMRFAVTAALGIPVLGCADYSFHDKTASESVELIKINGNGQNVSVFPPGLFDLDLSGDGNTVHVPCGCSIRNLRISGVNHHVTELPGASVQLIRLSGPGTVIHLPANVHPVVQGSGVNNRIVNDVDGSKRDCPNDAKNEKI
ncbi:MAG: hypothetical protein PHT19_17120 [Methylococcus sp.]|nr:hypothetical protein [Methylococcus sp.]